MCGWMHRVGPIDWSCSVYCTAKRWNICLTTCSLLRQSGSHIQSHSIDLFFFFSMIRNTTFFHWFKHQCSNLIDHKQASQVIPSYFSGNENCHSKGKKSSQNKMFRLEDSTFATPVCEIHFEVAIYELWHFCLMYLPFREILIFIVLSPVIWKALVEGVTCRCKLWIAMVTAYLNTKPLILIFSAPRCKKALCAFQITCKLLSFKRKVAFFFILEDSWRKWTDNECSSSINWRQYLTYYETYVHTTFYHGSKLTRLDIYWKFMEVSFMFDICTY